MGLLGSLVKKVVVATAVVVVKRVAARVIRKVAGKVAKSPVPPAK